ncbi:MAG: ATP-dependent Clp protease ATP-binding subunit ClpX [Lachnospiraceae bacterium]|nr:ATP-dependent Clp protease ATP-binding subunit ClpX [Lachnospiraceae bacterium]
MEDNFTKDTEDEQVKDNEQAGASTEETKNEDTEKRTRYCSSCRRGEDKTGKLTEFPGGFLLCSDCIQKGLNFFGNSSKGDFTINDGTSEKKMDNFGDFMKELEKLTGFPLFKINPVKKAAPKKEKAAQASKELSLKSLPAPHVIKKHLDEYVVGQDRAKKSIAVAVYNHYKRILSPKNKDVEIQKSNLLMLGPTGCGKTYLVQTLAKMLDVPLAIADATSLTEAGYIGDDIESVISKLLSAAGDDVEKAQKGIVFIDEIDKLARKTETRSRDVSGESVQQGLLKLLEGSSIEVPVGASSKSAMVPLVTVDTSNILFICGGAFPDLEEIIKKRLLKKSSMGFGAQLKDSYDRDVTVLSKVTTEDLREFGMIPEFLGRLPVIVTLEAMSEDMLVRILSEPKNAILKQYRELLAIDAVDLQFTDEALHIIAKKAMEKDIGARALRAVIEEYMLDIMYEIPKDPNIGRVTITADYLENKGGPIIEMRGSIAQDSVPALP